MPSPYDLNQTDGFSNDVDVLNYVYKFQADLHDEGLSFKITPFGHPEYYAYGGRHLAICIYDFETHDRLELLVVAKQMSTSMIDLSVKEMLNMIKRKRIGPVSRRIKE